MAAVVLTGCVSYRGGSFGPDLRTSGQPRESGTMGVSTGDMPASGITGSDAAPRGFGR